jgi:hypothetical protein
MAKEKTEKFDLFLHYTRRCRHRPGRQDSRRGAAAVAQSAYQRAGKIPNLVASDAG